MYLRAFRVENFRGIVFASLSFDKTTVLIGENDCGKSSILEALAIALGVGADGHAFAFDRHHAHLDGDDPAPVRIALTLEEDAPGQWNSTLPRKLKLWTTRWSAPRTLYVEVQAAWAGPGDEPIVTWGARTRRDGPLLCVNSPELIQWVRRISPLLWLRGGIVSSTPEPRNGPPIHSGNVEIDQMIDAVEEHYRSVVAGTSSDLSAELEKGFAAARSLLEQSGGTVTGAWGRLGPALEEITGRQRVPSASTPGPPRYHGGAAQKIGLLLLVGAVLRSGYLVAPGTAPVILIEDPEAHLHPMTLASVWGILEQIRWQKIVATHSGTLLSGAPLSSIRRLLREKGVVLEFSVPHGKLSSEELRRWSYHIRSRRASAMFARCWLLVEGETEFWLLPELARILGYDLAVEGVTCVEFAQSGLTALIKVAQNLGIEWHLLSDGDEAGQHYRDMARPFFDPEDQPRRVTVLAERDIEHCFYQHGFAHIYRKAAFPNAKAPSKGSPKATILQAVGRTSKPYLALQILEAVADAGPGRVPSVLRRAIETAIDLARHST
ncbi:MAG: DUF2813 domain-containing protein [Bryobacterales bacterium]|nr:DUF2813 domain-containing protein [Bryobacterales bacterium]